MEKIKDERISFISKNLSKEDPHEFLKVGADVIMKLKFIGDIPGLSGLNRQVKIDRLIIRDIIRLSRNPKYFLYERKPALINKRNGHILDGQHTITTAIKFIERFPELKDKFEMYIELWDINSMEEEEKFVRECNSFHRSWKGIDYFNQGLNSMTASRRINFENLNKIIKHLSIKFSGQRITNSKLQTIAGYCINSNGIHKKIKGTAGELHVTDGDVIDAIDLINLAFTIESLARQTYTDENGEEVAKSDFTLQGVRFWSSISRLVSIESFNKLNFINYVKNNWKSISWWEGDPTASTTHILNRLLEVSVTADAISVDDYYSNYK